MLPTLPNSTLGLPCYIAALMLFPATVFPARLSAILQLFLQGIFIGHGGSQARSSLANRREGSRQNRSLRLFRELTFIFPLHQDVRPTPES